MTRTVRRARPLVAVTSAALPTATLAACGSGGVDTSIDEHCEA